MRKTTKALRIISVILAAMMTVSIFAGCDIDLVNTAEIGGDENNGGDGKMSPYNFESYNTLELTVSDKEKFVLTIEPELVDDSDPDNMRFAGYGDWHKDGLVYPVYFFEKEFNDIEEAPNGCRGFIIVYDFRRVAEYEVYVPDDFYAIAMIINDSNNPMIKRWVSGNVDFPTYDAKWAAGEIVNAATKNK